MISEISEIDFDAVDFRCHEEFGDMNGRRVISLEVHAPDFAVDILNRKVENSRFPNREIKPMMSRGVKVSIGATYEDKDGNKYGAEVSFETGPAENINDPDNKPDSGDRDFDKK